MAYLVLFIVIEIKVHFIPCNERILTHKIKSDYSDYMQ